MYAKFEHNTNTNRNLCCDNQCSTEKRFHRHGFMLNSHKILVNFPDFVWDD